MAVNNLVRRLAARAPAPTFVIAAATTDDVEALRLDRRLRVVDSPRHATVALVAGTLCDELRDPAALVHDALPHPRATVWWGDGDPGVKWLRECPHVPAGEDPSATVHAVHADLMQARRISDPPVVTVTSRAPWQGVGPYGHGGSGMTGGTPHGRPLTDRADDPRDGLALDVLPVTIGPFFPAWPAGLTLQVSLHGDVVGAADVLADPFVNSDLAFVSPHARVFDQARAEPTGVAELERGRACHHLRAVARTLRLHGLHALARRALRLAVADQPDDQAVRRLLTTVEWTGLARRGAGVGVLAEEQATGRGLGLAMRASGVAHDVRKDDPAYTDLGFEPLTQPGGDAAARLDQRMAEIRQALRLAERAADRVRQPGPPVEDPRLPLAVAAEVLADLLIGAEWGDAVTTIDSFDIVMGLPRPADVPADAA